MTVFVLPLVLDLAEDQFLQSGSKVYWCDQQFTIFLFPRIARQVVKQVGGIFANLRIAGEHPHVFIQVGGGIVSPETGIPGLPRAGVILWKGR